MPQGSNPPFPLPCLTFPGPRPGDDYDSCSQGESSTTVSLDSNPSEVSNTDDEVDVCEPAAQPALSGRLLNGQLAMPAQGGGG